MYMGPEMMRYFQQLHDYLQAQNATMEKMQKTIEQMHKDISELKEKQVPSVTKNEYKFDLLKVEKLEGTLNIGLNPKSSEGSIDEMSVHQSMDVPPASHQAQQTSPSFDRVREQVYRYLDHDARQDLERIEQECGFPLDDAYRSFILTDIKKQINQRILYYLNQMDISRLEPEQLEPWEEKTVQKVKRDIERTCESFIKNLPREVQDS